VPSLGRVHRNSAQRTAIGAAKRGSALLPLLYFHRLYSDCNGLPPTGPQISQSLSQSLSQLRADEPDAGRNSPGG
jgi:hypothetical protein